MKRKGRNAAGSDNTTATSDADQRARDFECEDCGKQFLTKSHLRDHILIHKGVRPFKCEDCPLRFYRSADLARHQRRGNCQRPYKCTICVKAYKDEEALRVHQRYHPDGEKPNRCDICGKGFARPVELRRHLRAHTGERPFACDICNKSFSQAENLGKHRELHDAKKEIECEVCHKKFATQTYLRRHSLQHSNSFKYECEVCPQKLLTKASFNRHLVTHHSVDAQQCCPLCSKVLPNREALKAHTKEVHRNNKRFLCSDCGLTFKTARQLAAHKREDFLHDGTGSCYITSISAKEEYKQPSILGLGNLNIEEEDEEIVEPDHEEGPKDSIVDTSTDLTVVVDGDDTVDLNDKRSLGSAYIVIESSSKATTDQPDKDDEKIIAEVDLMSRFSLDTNGLLMSGHVVLDTDDSADDAAAGGGDTSADNLVVAAAGGTDEFLLPTIVSHGKMGDDIASLLMSGHSGRGHNHKAVITATFEEESLRAVDRDESAILFSQDVGDQSVEPLLLLSTGNKVRGLISADEAKQKSSNLSSLFIPSHGDSEHDDSLLLIGDTVHGGRQSVDELTGTASLLIPTSVHGRSRSRSILFGGRHQPSLQSEQQLQELTVSIRRRQNLEEEMLGIPSVVRSHLHHQTELTSKHIQDEEEEAAITEEANFNQDQLESMLSIAALPVSEAPNLTTDLAPNLSVGLAPNLIMAPNLSSSSMPPSMTANAVKPTVRFTRDLDRGLFPPKQEDITIVVKTEVDSLASGMLEDNSSNGGEDGELQEDKLLEVDVEKNARLSDHDSIFNDDAEDGGEAGLSRVRTRGQAREAVSPLARQMVRKSGSVKRDKRRGRKRKGKEQPRTKLKSSATQRKFTRTPDGAAFCCSFCPRTFRFVSQLKVHLLCHTGERPHSCDHCSKTFSTRSHQRSHMVTHKKEKSFICELCSMSFTHKHTMSRHLRTLHRNDERNVVFTCHLCNKVLRYQESYKKHMESHNRSGPHRCEDCKKSFTSRQTLMQHRVDRCPVKFAVGHQPAAAPGDDRHGVDNNDSRKLEGARSRVPLQPLPVSDRLQPDMRFQCPLCVKRFKVRANAICHLRTHTGDKPFVCNTCDASFATMSNLCRHEKSHREERPYQCDQCNKTFAVPSYLNLHKRTKHSGNNVKQLKCDFCDKSFKFASHLAKHRKLHHPEDDGLLYDTVRLEELEEMPRLNEMTGGSLLEAQRQPRGQPQPYIILGLKEDRSQPDLDSEFVLKLM